jgi:hypothetical protein
MKTTAITKFVRKKSAVYQEVDGIIHILDQRQDAILTLNDTATLLWKILAKPLSLTELVSALVSKYSVSTKQAHRDASEFVNTMQKAGLVQKA